MSYYNYNNNMTPTTPNGKQFHHLPACIDGPFDHIYRTIFSTIKFDSDTNRVRIVDDHIGTLSIVCDHLCEWITVCDGVSKLQLFQSHFEATNALLSALIEEHVVLQKKREVYDQNNDVITSDNVYALYTVAVIEFCRLLEGFFRHLPTMAKHATSLPQAATLLSCPPMVVQMRNRLAHAGCRPSLHELHKVLYVISHWLKKNFFSNLTLVWDSHNRAKICLALNFPRLRRISSSDLYMDERIRPPASMPVELVALSMKKLKRPSTPTSLSSSLTTTTEQQRYKRTKR